MITSLNLLAAFPLIRARTPSAAFAARARCRLTFNLVSASPLGAFSAKLFSGWVAPGMYWGGGVVPPQVQDLAVACVELHEAPASPFLQPVSGWQHDPLACQPLLPVLYRW